MVISNRKSLDSCSKIIMRYKVAHRFEEKAALSGLGKAVTKANMVIEEQEPKSCFLRAPSS